MSPHREKSTDPDKRELLTLARHALETSTWCEFICVALEAVVAGTGPQEGARPDLAEAAVRIKWTISEGIEYHSTLDCWLTEQGLNLTRDQLHLARLAWIDRLLEDTP